MSENPAEKISFCSAEKVDVPVIFALSKELIDAYEDVSSIAYEKVLDWVQNKIQQNISSYTRICMNGKTVGYFRLIPDGAQTELDDFYVLEEYRNRGIGTMVLRQCIAMSEGPVYLYVFRKNARAIKLYTAMGFVIAEEVGKTRFIMRCEVDFKSPQVYNMDI